MHLLSLNTPQTGLTTLILSACVCFVMFVSVLHAFELSAAGVSAGWMHIRHADLSGILSAGWLEDWLTVRQWSQQMSFPRCCAKTSHEVHAVSVKNVLAFGQKLSRSWAPLSWGIRQCITRANPAAASLIMQLVGLKTCSKQQAEQQCAVCKPVEDIIRCGMWILGHEGAHRTCVVLAGFCGTAGTCGIS